MDAPSSSFTAADLARTFGMVRRMGLRTGSVQGLRQSEALFLVHVVYLNHSESSQVKVSDLSSSLNMTQSAATHMMKTLEEKGYLIRVASQKDKRVVLVKPTESGRNMIDETENQFLQLFTGLVEHLGEKDGQELNRLLNITLTYISKHWGGKS
ncbi:MarR family winged helix-turn-helix transcriptional regulator [Paenibacillus periandrae]|uniref:MarR family winged helix-turn-helix transcriptional regulator n=1 Tax=Paenibacillus periandrae TaxID=1761741 RepID=UPI001F09A94D|nr:MarR family winged helix-turn-helix transcriptional regulator [Paenibacillus periandrae]